MNIKNCKLKNKKDVITFLVIKKKKQYDCRHTPCTLGSISEGLSKNVLSMLQTSGTRRHWSVEYDFAVTLLHYNVSMLHWPTANTSIALSNFAFLVINH